MSILEELPVHKAHVFEGNLGPFQIFAPQQDIHILGVSNRGFIHLAYQSRHGVATHHRMGNARLLQCPGGTKQSIAHFLHSVLHCGPECRCLGRLRCS